MDKEGTVYITSRQLRLTLQLHALASAVWPLAEQAEQAERGASNSRSVSTCHELTGFAFFNALLQR